MSKQKDSSSVWGILKQYRWVWSNDIDGYSFAVCPVTEQMSGEARRHFNMGMDENILFYYKDEGFWAGQRSFTAITENGIWGQVKEDDQVLYVPWSEVKEVKYQEFNLYFFNYDGEYTNFGIGFFTKNCVPDQGRKISKVFNECASIVAPNVDPYEELIELEDEGKYDEALLKQEQAATSGAIKVDYLYHFYRGRFLVKKEGTLEDHSEDSIRLIEKEFEKAVELSEDENFKAYCDYWRGYLNHYLGRNYLSRNYFILAMDAESEEMRDDAKEAVISKEEELTEIWDSYTTRYEYKDRKFLMPIRDGEIAGCIVEGIDTFRLSNVPSCIKFPTGHPVANELYIGHPYNPSMYVPYSESEDIFFLDKVDELTYLLQCLGAEEITITSIKGKSVSEYDNRSAQYSAHIDTGITDVSGSGSKASKNEQNYDSKQQHTLHIKCDPMKYPYIPDGLIWYGEQPRWQRMVEGRLNGNRLEYSESISSTDTRFVSNTEKKDIKAAAQRLWIKVEGSAEANLETQFKEHTETQWRVDVQFRSLRAFSEPQITTSQPLVLASSDEQEYIEMYKEYAAEGEISERDLRMLDKFRVRCGISEERARDLEASCSKPQLNEDEQEYLELFKEYAADGEISERDRKMLYKMRDRMGISEERAKEIEQY